jgi:hypothetical protein
MVCVYTGACIRAYKEKISLYFNWLIPKHLSAKTTCMHAVPVSASEKRGVHAGPNLARTPPVPRLPKQGCPAHSKFKSQLSAALFRAGSEEKNIYRTYVSRQPEFQAAPKVFDDKHHDHGPPCPVFARCWQD